MFKWRNDPETIATSVSRKQISAADHQDWMLERTFNPAHSVFIFESNGVPVGSYTLIVRDTKKVEISYMVAPEHRGFGQGKAMIEAAIASIRGKWTVVSRTRKENEASQRVLEHAGMVLVSENDDYFFYKKEI